MKKLFYLLFLLPLAFLASCNNDDDFPQVELTLTLSNVYQDSSNGQFYYVENEESNPVIDGLKATTLIDGKQAAVTNVFYTLNNYVRLWGTEEEPMKPVIPSEYMKEGVNYINVSATILQVDKSVANCYLDIPLNAVSSEDELPDGIGDMGTYSYSMKMQPKN